MFVWYRQISSYCINSVKNMTLSGDKNDSIVSSKNQ